jgi:hypothetical protein
MHKSFLVGLRAHMIRLPLLVVEMIDVLMPTQICKS